MDRPVAIVTGGSSGIGLAASRMLIEHGYTVVIAARNPERLNNAKEELGEHCQAEILDAADPDSVTKLILTVDKRFGRLDVLINNAGLAPLLPIPKTDPDLIGEVYAVNAIAPAIAIHHAWPIFERQRSGCVINISTIGTQDPFPGFFAYASAKAATNLQIKSVASEGAAIGVRGFAIAPGAVETPMLRSIISEKQVPPEKCLSPDDIAAIILACVQGERDEDNGKVIWAPNPG